MYRYQLCIDGFQHQKDNVIPTGTFGGVSRKPPISCGAYRFPIEEACDIAMKTVMEKSINSRLEMIVFACFEDKIKKALNKSYLNQNNKS